MQRTRSRALCESKGYEIVASFEGLGESGRTLDRPSMNALLAAARAGEIDVVVVYRLDRLARKASDLLRIWEDHFASCGVELASATESVDTSTPMGRAMMGMTGVFAQMESELIQERTSDGKREKARQGGFGNAVRSFGFKWNREKKRPEIVEHEAEVSRTIFTMAASGHNVESICKTLTRQGVKRRKGGEWWNGEMQAMIANPIYMGRFVTYRDPETGEETLADPDLCPPPIVDAATWQAAQTVTQGWRKTSRRKVRRQHLLSGFLTCAACGRTLTIRQPDARHAYYACNSAAQHRNGCDLRHIPSADLDAEIWDQIREWASNPEVLRRCAQETRADLLPQWRRALVRVGEQMKIWQGRERQAREYLETGVYAPADFARTKNEYDTHMADLRAEAEELERKIAQAEQNEQNVDWTARTLMAAGDLDALDLDAKRRLLSALAVKVTVKTYTDERGRLKDWTAELESYGAVVTGLAVTGAMC
jgi:site-specific DNA recombinase